MKQVINNYGRVDPREGHGPCTVTAFPVEEVNAKIEITWFPPEDQPPLGYVWYDLPLDGQWSDVTAVFDIWPGDEQLLLELSSIRVM